MSSQSLSAWVRFLDGRTIPPSVRFLNGLTGFSRAEPESRPVCLFGDLTADGDFYTIGGVPTPMSSAEKIRKSLADLSDLALRTDSLRDIRHIPAQEGRYRPYPPDVHTALTDVLKARGFSELYSHQQAAWETVGNRRNAVVVTPTASGKTLCYNLPVLDAILKDTSTRALYLFPTKALANDQRAELDEVARSLPEEIRIFTY
ncbi:MAG: DEAD/DEAH box helicase, partial [Candidatus Aminicenantes bacterium]|nr:DEAD/DEAH box helicase [Candidatus Aminicenantes bacterium]